MDLLMVIGVVALLVLLAAALLPALAAAKRYSGPGCANNLLQIYLSTKIWSGDSGDKLPTQLAATNDVMMKLIGSGKAYVLWQTMSNELSTPKVLVCQADTKRHYATNFSAGFSDANISYFLSLDASFEKPQTIIAGDDNFFVDGKLVQSGILNVSTNVAVEWTKERKQEKSGRPHSPGNIVLADGSVQPLNNAGLWQVFQQTGSATNRFVIP